MTAHLDLPTDLDALANLKACLDLVDKLPENSNGRALMLRRAEAYLVLLSETQATP